MNASVLVKFYNFSSYTYKFHNRAVVKNNHHQTNTPQSIIIIIRVVTHFHMSVYNSLYNHIFHPLWAFISSHKKKIKIVFGIRERKHKTHLNVQTPKYAMYSFMRVTKKRYYFTVVSHHDVMIIVNHLLKQVGRMVIRIFFCSFSFVCLFFFCFNK